MVSVLLWILLPHHGRILGSSPRRFHGFFPQEAQVMQVGMGLRSVLPPGNRVFVKGPHTPFNEHARDHMKSQRHRVHAWTGPRGRPDTWDIS